jgi:hypothetical protein
MAKNKMKRTYTCVVVNDDSLSNKVNIKATMNESRKYRTDLFWLPIVFKLTAIAVKRNLSQA